MNRIVRFTWTVDKRLGGLALMMTKTITGTKSSAAGTDFEDAMDKRFMIV